MILNTLDNLGKLKAKRDEGYFIGYSMSSKAFRVFNKRTKRVEENLHVDLLENKAIEKGDSLNWLFDIDSLTKSMNYVLVVVAGTNSTIFLGTKDAASQKVKKDVSSLRYIALPNSIHEVHLESSSKPSSDTRLISKRVANQVETPSLDNIITLTNRFEDILGVTTNSDESNGVEADVLKNKKNERGIVIRNKAKLVAQGHTKEEGIDYDKIDVKSAFLYGTIDEEVGTIDQTLFIRRQRGDFILLQVYVDDIIFGLSNPQLCREFEALMHEKFQMSAMGELNFFLSLQVLQKEDDIMFAICACARHQVTPKECHLHAVKRIFRYLKSHPKLGLWYPKESPFDLVQYSYSDYGCATQDRKSTTGGCQILGRRLSIQCEALSKEISSSILLLLAFCHYHNMVAILEKSENNVDFHPIVDFIEASPLSPKSTGFNEFSSNIDTTLVCLATNRIYNFAKMIFDGMVNNPSFSGRIVPLFDTMLVPQGEGLGIPIEPYHTPSLEVQQTSPTTYSSQSLPPVTTVNIPPGIPTAPLPTVVPTHSPQLRHYSGRARIAQSSALPPVADEPASPLRDVNQGEACPTELTDLCTSLQRQQSDMVSKFEAQELEITMLKAKVKPLEDREGEVAERSRDDAPIKGRRLDVGEEAVKRINDDTEEMATVLTSMDALTILSSRVAKVPTSSGSIPTAGPMLLEFPLAVMWFPPLREFYTSVLRNQAGWKAKDFKGMTLEEIKENFEPMWKQIHDFIPIGSKEEAGRFKRKGIRFEHESVKKLKTSEEVKATEDIPEEKVKEMMQLVPIKEITRLGGSSASYQFFVDMLKHLDREDLNQLWRLVKESLSIRPAASDKEMELWVELKRLYEPDDEEQL
nr:hypothetical protein [Tanacetum cinerariifolium]